MGQLSLVGLFIAIASIIAYLFLIPAILISNDKQLEQIIEMLKKDQTDKQNNKTI